MNFLDKMLVLHVQRHHLAREFTHDTVRQRMLEEMQIRNFSENTRKCYLQQVSVFARHFRRSPEGLGPANIRDYQLYLTNEKKLAPGSILIATSALRFLYAVTMKRPWDVEEVLPMPKKPEKLPVILSPEEVRHFLSCIPRRKARTALTVCYAAGLRVSEAIALKPNDIDSQRMTIRVTQGKGQKDRVCRARHTRSYAALRAMPRGSAT